jgi:ankyrin repeat protein
MTDTKSDYFSAIQKGDAATVSELFRNDPKLLNAKSQNGMSGVITAMYYGQKEIAELLASNGAVLDIFDASALGKTKRVTELLNEDSKLMNSFSADGFTPLHLAVFFRNYDAAKLLISKGANVDAVAKNSMRVAPLHSAAAGNEPRIVKLLIECGADVNAKQQGGYTALHAAAQSGNVEMAEFLIEHGANINSKTEDGRTPLAIAKEESREAGRKEDRDAVGKLLVQHGAS